MQGFKDMLLQRADLAKAFDRQTPLGTDELKAAHDKLDLNNLVT